MTPAPPRPQVLYRWSRHGGTSVIETNGTSVELALPPDQDCIVEVKPFSDGGDGSASEQIRIPKRTSKDASPPPPASPRSLEVGPGGLGRPGAQRASWQKQTAPSPRPGPWAFAGSQAVSCKGPLTRGDPSESQAAAAPGQRPQCGPVVAQSAAQRVGSVTLRRDQRRA